MRYYISGYTPLCLPFKPNYYVTAYYDAVLYLAHAFNETAAAGGDLRDGRKIAQMYWNSSFPGMWRYHYDALIRYVALSLWHTYPVCGVIITTHFPGMWRYHSVFNLCSVKEARYCNKLKKKLLLRYFFKRFYLTYYKVLLEKKLFKI